MLQAAVDDILRDNELHLIDVFTSVIVESSREKHGISDTDADSLPVVSLAEFHNEY